MLIGNDTHTGAYQRIVPDIHATGPIHNAEVVDLDTIAKSYPTISALHIGIAIEGHLIAKSNTSAARCIH